MTNHEEHEYLNLLRRIIAEGVDSPDRTGVGTKSVFGASLRFDLSKGFPLITTKRTFFKGIVHELLWFIKGSTSIKYLQDNNIHIWDDWADEDGELGPVYGRQWRHWEHIEWVEPKIFEKPEYQRYETPFNKEVVIKEETHIDSFRNKYVGYRNEGKTGEFVVTEELPLSEKGSRRFVVKFLNTGYEKAVNLATIRRNSMSDPWAPTSYGVACIGDGSRDSPFYDTWHGMIKRCYDKTHMNYGNYGGRGVFVEDRWLVFSNFEKDVKNIPNAHLKMAFPKDYTLDKDFYCSNIYSRETCRWLTHEEQSTNTEKGDSVIHVTDPEGNEFVSMGMKKLCRLFGFKSPCVLNCLNGKQETHHGYKFKRIKRIGKIPRLVVYDQLKDAVAKIKSIPHSRRILINSWNVGDIIHMKLPPCHLYFQFQVSNGKLNCLFLMRSTDAFLGLPFNIASYALLTHMVAQVCGLEPGELVYNGVDVHLYQNHINQARKQISREPFSFPNIQLNPEIKEIDDFKYEDIKLNDYKSHKSIKAPIAV